MSMFKNLRQFFSHFINLETYRTMDRLMHKTVSKDVILIITDISGYTKFLLNDEISRAHGHLITAQLLESIIKKVKIPLKISKLEGDAVFMYSVKPRSLREWEKHKKMIRERLPIFYRAFSSKLRKMIMANTCECNACKNMSQLDLKIIVHSGEAQFIKIGRFYELAGKDVVLIHRLLKNSIKAKSYILMTRSALEDINFAEGAEYSEKVELLPDFGEIKVYVSLLKEQSVYIDFMDNIHDNG